jgi:hypothetical protein
VFSILVENMMAYGGDITISVDPASSVLKYVAEDSYQGRVTQAKDVGENTYHIVEGPEHIPADRKPGTKYLKVHTIEGQKLKGIVYEGNAARDFVTGSILHAETDHKIKVHVYGAAAKAERPELKGLIVKEDAKP